MRSRKIFRTVSSALTIFLLSDYIIPAVKANCGKDPPIPSYYTAGKGSRLIECVKNSYRDEYERLRNFLAVKDTTIPEIRYNTLKGRIVGSYFVDNDVIVFDTSKVIFIENNAICNSTVGHEFAHAQFNRKSKEIGNGKWPKFSINNRRRFTLEDYSMQIISEGLANYIGENEIALNLPGKWPKNREEFYCSSPYILGPFLVTPLIDEFGSEAVPVMIKNPPRGAEVLDPRLYQDSTRARILQARK